MKMLNYLTWSSEAERIQGYSLWNTVVLHRIPVTNHVKDARHAQHEKHKSRKAVEVSRG
jgi:hypothetical protein